MKKYIVPFLLGVAVSFFFFPVGFTFLPSALNTKNLMAAIGALFFAYDSVKAGSLSVRKDVLMSAVLAILFSFVCFVAIVENDTNDMTYVTYISSFLIWIFSAYCVCVLLRMRYNHLTIEIVTKYLMWVGVGQCIAMLLIDNVPAFSALVDRFVGGNEFIKRKNRKYGIGCGLDPGGVRLTIILTLMSYVSTRSIFPQKRFWKSASWIFAFIFITVFGNMISRTTIVGAGIGLAYILLYTFTIRRGGELTADRTRTLSIFILLLAVAVPVFSYLYNTSPSMRSDLRFAFEGFFNWAETGVWSTSSTDKLNAVMWVWPTNTHDWIIGTGIIDSYAFSTDIGYCRFILYCGIVGFSVFCIYFIYNSIAVARRFNGVGLLSLMLLALTFIIWIKVSTDIFQIYAILFCLDAYGVSDLELDPEEEIDTELLGI